MTTITTTPADRLVRTGSGRTLWKAGAIAGAAAAVATTVFAAACEAVGVSLDIGGETIPRLGFAQLTLIATLVGTVLAIGLARRAAHPRRTFLLTTMVLTALSFVPDVTADAPNGTRLALALSHVVAAAIVIPALASKLSD